jgi:acetaldehyde dehydrogenase (acetylating)
MARLDKDLLAIQETRNLIEKAKEAQRILETFTQEQVDRIVSNMAQEGEAAADWLAKTAVEETEIGVYEHKVIKNLFAVKMVYESIKEMKTVGLIRKDPVKMIWEVAEPVGVIAALTPTTNPTSTALYKSLIAIKSRNAIVFSPHPRAVDCTSQAVELMHKAAIRAGAPEGIIGCLTAPSLEAIQVLIKHKDVDLILATGGADMVKAAYSSGKPAYGVGPGNVPAYIERSADTKKAVESIIESKSFDNGTICSSEQAVICERSNSAEVKKYFEEMGGAFLSKEDMQKLEEYMFLPNGRLNPSIVGKSAVEIARNAQIKVSDDVKVILAPLDGVGKEFLLSKEKLSPVLAFYEVNDWKEASNLSIQLLEMGGKGHSMSIHSNNEEIIKAFALEQPVSRLLVNQPSSFGAIGSTTGLMPSLTLGCGTLGNNITTDNISPMHLLNIKRVAYGIKTIAELKGKLLNETIQQEIGTDREVIEKVIEEVLKRLTSVETIRGR